MKSPSHVSGSTVPVSFSLSAHSGRNGFARIVPPSHSHFNTRPTKSNRHNPHPRLPHPLKNLPGLRFSPSAAITAPEGGNPTDMDGLYANVIGSSTSPPGG